MAEKQEWVEIEVTKKMIDMEHPLHNEKNGKDYVRIIGPEGSSFLYPAASLHISKNDENKVTFSRPAGTEIQLRYSKRNEGVPDDAPNKEKWSTETKTVLIEDLKEMYTADREAYRDRSNEQNNSEYVNMTVPTDWGYTFESKKGDSMVAVSISIRENNESSYWSFVMPADRFKESTKEEGMSYFGFPRHNNEGNDFMIRLKNSEKQENGNYIESTRDVSSERLKELVDSAKERSASMDRFVSVDVSEKLVRYFSSQNGNELAALSVPVYLSDADEKARFYEIVVPAKNVKPIDDRDGILKVSMYKYNSDGEAYTHTARYSEKNMESGEYEEQKMTLTSEEVSEKFRISTDKYRESQQSERSIADEMNQSRHRGR